MAAATASSSDWLVEEFALGDGVGFAPPDLNVDLILFQIDCRDSNITKY